MAVWDSETESARKLLILLLLSPNTAGSSCCQIPSKLPVWQSRSIPTLCLLFLYFASSCFISLDHKLGFLLANVSCTQFKLSWVESSCGSHSCSDMPVKFMARACWVFEFFKIHQDSRDHPVAAWACRTPLALACLKYNIFWYPLFYKVERWPEFESYAVYLLPQSIFMY